MLILIVIVLDVYIYIPWIYLKLRPGLETAIFNETACIYDVQGTGTL